MENYEAAMAVMRTLFSKDCVFALATVSEGRPSVRMVDTYYEDGAFYVVTYGNSTKVKALAENDNVALCSELYRFEGTACVIGHPLEQKNAALREKLIRVFEPWYFMHNNEGDAAMCYMRIDPRSGFVYGDGTGYRMDFANKTAEAFPFTMDAVMPE